MHISIHKILENQILFTYQNLFMCTFSFRWNTGKLIECGNTFRFLFVASNFAWFFHFGFNLFRFFGMTFFFGFLCDFVFSSSRVSVCFFCSFRIFFALWNHNFSAFGNSTYLIIGVFIFDWYIIPPGRLRPFPLHNQKTCLTIWSPFVCDHQCNLENIWFWINCFF